jgi:hypothetical protein
VLVNAPAKSTKDFVTRSAVPLVIRAAASLVILPFSMPWLFDSGAVLLKAVKVTEWFSCTAIFWNPV